MAQLNDLIVLGNTSLIGDINASSNLIVAGLIEGKLKSTPISSNGKNYLLFSETTSEGVNLKLHEDVYYYYGGTYSSLNVGKTTKDGILTLWKNNFNTDIKSSATAARTITLPDQTGIVALKNATNTFSAANTFSGNNTFSGTNTFSGQVILSRTTDAQGDKNNEPALRIGAISGTHLEFDGNEIMAKTSGTAVGPLYLNNNGGLVSIGSGGLEVGGTATFNSTSTFKNNLLLNSSSVHVQRAGISQSWYQGRNSAIIKTTSYSGYDAILSMKTTAGDWALGVYNDNKMYFTYILDSNYNANTNTTTAQVRFDPDGNVAAAKFSGSGAGLTSLNASNISTGTLAAARLPNHASTATTYGVGDATHYGHVLLYPAASCTSYTSDGGGACTPAAVKKAIGLFEPKAHNHSAGNITSGTLAVARGGTGRGAYATTKYTENQYRGSKIQNTIPTSIDNGCLVYVYADTTTI